MLAVCKQLRLLMLTLSVVLAALVSSTSAGAVPRPMLTGIEVNFANINWANRPTAYQRVSNAGASYVRIVLLWSQVASTEPAHPLDPNDPAYDWTLFDNQVDGVLAKGLKPMVTVWNAPVWAEDRHPTDDIGWGAKQWHPGTIRPSAVDYGNFAHALAARYKGKVDTWEVWNEPNLRWFLNPQQELVGDTAVWRSPDAYRALVNAFAANVRPVDSNARIIAGSTSPHGHSNPAPYAQPGPLLFMRKVLCLSSTNVPQNPCTPLQADAWSTHPYTHGGPTHHASNTNDISLGDLPRMRKALMAAANALPAHIVSTHPPVQFWVGEFGWDSNAPDPKSYLPLKLHARWTSEALYRAWKAGVSVFIWHQLRDEPLPARAYQAGLYFCHAKTTTDDNTCSGSTNSIANDVAKPSLRAFTFPFVAFKGTTNITLWGRTPGSVGGQPVTIQRRVSGVWRKMFDLTPNEFGIFTRTWRSSLSSTSVLRAKLGTKTSVGFSLTRVADRVVDPFGCGGGISCPTLN
jgi:hypothetical protein